MNNYLIIFIAQAIFIFLVIVLLGSFVFATGSNKKGQITKKKSIYSTFSPKMLLYILLASLAITYFLSYYSEGLLTKVVVFLTVITLAPYFIKNNADRIKREDTFNDIIIYCSNMGMLLKQTHNVYSSLDKVKEDVGSELAKDIEILQESFNESKENTKEIMEAFEKKYPYTCINNLDIILVHLFYEAPKFSDELFNTYLNDISELEQDVKKNKTKRLSMRFTYFGLTIGGYLMFVYFYKSMTATALASLYAEASFKFICLAYVFLTLLALFLVDRYFNANTTRE